MFQREVAERIVAKPRHARHYGRLSVLTQWRAQREDPVRCRAARLHAAAENHILHRAHRAAGRAAWRRRGLPIWKVTAAAFGQRRKMLRQSLKRSSPDPEALLLNARDRSQARPETAVSRAFRSAGARASHAMVESGEAAWRAKVTSQVDNLKGDAMLSQAVVEFGAPLKEIETPTPEPTGTEVLLKMHNAGVCHSDVHIHDGYFDLGGGNKLPLANIKLPHTMGHEIEGEVVAVGSRRQGREGRRSLCGVSVDRLRRVPGLSARRGKSCVGGRASSAAPAASRADMPPM